MPSSLPKRPTHSPYVVNAREECGTAQMVVMMVLVVDRRVARRVVDCGGGDDNSRRGNRDSRWVVPDDHHRTTTTTTMMMTRFCCHGKGVVQTTAVEDGVAAVRASTWVGVSVAEVRDVVVNMDTTSSNPVSMVDHHHCEVVGRPRRNGNDGCTHVAVVSAGVVVVVLDCANPCVRLMTMVRPSFSSFVQYCFVVSSRDGRYVSCHGEVPVAIFAPLLRLNDDERYQVSIVWLYQYITQPMREREGARERERNDSTTHNGVKVLSF